MWNADSVDVGRFDRDGYIVVKGVLERDEATALRRACLAARDRAAASGLTIRDGRYPGASYVEGDLPTHPELKPFDYVVFHPRVVASAKRLLGTNPIYWGDSSFQTGAGGRGFHKDNVDRSDGRGPDWRGRYGVIRFGFYLQDHARHSGGLKVRRGSHNYVSHHRGRSVNVPTELGDVVFWFLRTSHSGNNVRLRWMPGVSLHPRLETKTPSFLQLPEAAERVAVFCSLAAPGGHLDRYIESQLGREDVRVHWSHSHRPADAEDLARARGVLLRAPTASAVSPSASAVA